MAKVREQKSRIRLVSPRGVRVTVGADSADRYLKRGYRRPSARTRAAKASNSSS